MDERRLPGSLVCVGIGMTLGSHLGLLVRSSNGPACRQVLVDVLARDYPLDHKVIIHHTPSRPLGVAPEMRARFKALDLPMFAGA